MPDPFIGELRMFGFNFAPRDWALCEGQIMSINQNQSLFSLLGTTYGGDGRTTFALPDLRGRAPMHRSSSHRLGSKTGVEAVQLVLDNVPSHTHSMMAAANTPANAANGAGGSFGETSSNVGAIYAAAGGTKAALRPESISTTGGGLHNNVQPFLTINWAIALQGVFPSRS